MADAIIDFTLTVLSRGTQEPYQVDAPGAARLKTALVTLKKEAGFKDELVKLVLFAQYLAEERKSPGAADVILRTAEAVVSQA